ncbi:MAG: pyridoxal kinase PdxY [Treponema sp.]|jgi:pyridoxine kinase|nr:pyridoxal kinase PdxY [Treponema sp.]
MAILSIQSHVVYGYAGNSAAVFPLQRLGREVWAINTVEFSNHTGYGAWRGSVLELTLVSELVAGLADRGVLSRCEAALSGYMGDAGTGAAVLEAVRKVKSASPKALYCCDPVMGDVGRGFYVKPGIPDVFRNEIVPCADIVTPNQFELEALTGISTTTPDGARRAVDALHEKGPGVALVTSYRGADGYLDMLASCGKGLYRTRTPELPFPTIMAGSGDITAAVFLSYYLEHADVKAALEAATSSIYGIMEATFNAQSRELLLIEAQEELVSPSNHFTAEKL